MDLNLFQTDEYKNLSKKNIYNTIEYLLKEGIEFNIVVYVDFIEFTPEVPKSIIDFEELSLFIISAYSFESASLDKDYLYFEAGFGAENFGSFLKVPLQAIAQIAIEVTLILINYYKPKKEKFQLDRSMDILLNNPENQKFLNKKSNKK